MPLAGHLLIVAGARFPLGGAVELEYRVDADLPHSLRFGSPPVADSDFALVFVTAPFTTWSPANAQYEIVVALPITWNPRGISE
jgi:hypothetical protein